MTHDLTFAASCHALLEACGWEKSELPMGVDSDPEPYWTKPDAIMQRGFRSLSEATDTDLDQLIVRGVRMLGERGVWLRRDGEVWCVMEESPSARGLSLYVAVEPNPLSAIVAALETEGCG